MRGTLKHRRLAGTRIDERDLRAMARDIAQMAGVPRLRLDSGLVEVLLHSPAFKDFGTVEVHAEIYLVRWLNLTEHGRGLLRALLEHWVNASAFCESPIEKLLLWGLLGLGICRASRGSQAGFEISALPARECAILVQQPVPGFIADFALCSPQAAPVIVECDGHDFHSSRHHQARDRARDRHLQLKGFRVLRFTGSQIVTDPNACAAELAQHWRPDA